MVSLLPNGASLPHVRMMRYYSEYYETGYEYNIESAQLIRIQYIPRVCATASRQGGINTPLARHRSLNAGPRYSFSPTRGTVTSLYTNFFRSPLP